MIHKKKKFYLFKIYCQNQDWFEEKYSKVGHLLKFELHDA